jgi:hypothetical protein
VSQVAANPTFPTAPLPHWTWLLLTLLWLVLMLAGYLTASGEQPASNPVPWWLVVPFGTALLPVGLGVLLAHRTIAIDGDHLEVAAALVLARKVALDALDLERARILSLDEHTELRPRLQTFGFSLPGFQAGHYRLRDGSKAFCLLTDRQRVLVLPQRDGSLLLLSPDKPQALLDALRARRVDAPGRSAAASHAGVGPRVARSDRDCGGANLRACAPFPASCTTPLPSKPGLRGCCAREAAAMRGRCRGRAMCCGGSATGAT